MPHRDREIGRPADGSAARARPAEARRIGEQLLYLDELEDTLEQTRRLEESTERVRALERRVEEERQSIETLQTQGQLDYEEIARVMEAVDRSG